MKAVLSVICLFWTLTSRAVPTTTRDVFRDAARVAIIDAPTKVEACFLTIDDPSKGSDLNKRRFVEGHYKILSEEVRTLIIWKLLDDRNYNWEDYPACIPTYNARVRFTRGDRVVAVDFCFGCSLIRVVESGKVVGGGYFQRGSDWVFQALARSFPHAPEIRDLKKRREERALLRFETEMAVAREERKKANQTPEPTATAVTPPAAQEPRQP